MNKRTRITLDQALLQEAAEYATADNRTFSELVSISLKERMHRFPKGGKETDNIRLTRLENRVEELLAIMRKS